MTLTLTHHTPIDSLNRATRQELKEALHQANWDDPDNLKSMKKKELVEEAELFVAQMRVDHEREEQDKEAARQQVIHAEKVNGTVDMIVKGLIRSVQKKMDGCQTTIDRFHERAQKGTITDAMEWMGEDVMKAEERLGKFDTLKRFLERSIGEERQTSTEILETLDDSVKQRMDELMRDGFRHNCTSAITNVHNMAAFAALQEFTKWEQAAIKALRKDLENGEAAHVRSISYVW